MEVDASDFAEPGHRRAGIQLHITSLPGAYGIGDLGPEAYNFLDWLAAAGQTCWQMMPLGPTGPGNSPYSARSSFAGNPMLISPEFLVRDGFLDYPKIEFAQSGWAPQVDFEFAQEQRIRFLRCAFGRFIAAGREAEMTEFELEHEWWLREYATFRAFRDHLESPWTDWPPGVRDAGGREGLELRERLADEIRFHAFVQWLFFGQWGALHDAALTRSISLIGDIPIFVDFDSADVWGHRELFKLGEDGHPTVVAGVPPDAFSATGQRWGNPVYDWRTHEAEGFAWWTRRLHHTLSLVDEVRIDHFRGFEAVWEIPPHSQTAEDGWWTPGPGQALFDAAQLRGRHERILVEDLGIITPEVHGLRDDLGFAGMNVLQFAFGDKADNAYLPHNHVRQSVLYTGTHDNDTTAGWFAALPDWERERVLHYLARDGSEIVDDLIRAAYASVARTAIVPMQDVLRMGSQARMNTPGVAAGQWGWRFSWEQLPGDRTGWLRDLAITYGRLPRA